jgi:hypothetical protein
MQVRGAVLDVSAITDRLCFATIRSEEIDASSAAATAPEHQIEVILKLRDGFLSLEQIAAARDLLNEVRVSGTIIEFDGFPERLLGVADQHPRPVSAPHRTILAPPAHAGAARSRQRVFSIRSWLCAQYRTRSPQLWHAPVLPSTTTFTLHFSYLHGK